jgi:hypothetical protein
MQIAHFLSSRDAKFTAAALQHAGKALYFQELIYGQELAWAMLTSGRSRKPPS